MCPSRTSVAISISESRPYLSFLTKLFTYGLCDILYSVVASFTEVYSEKDLFESLLEILADCINWVPTVDSFKELL